MTIGDNIKKYRKQNKLTQKQLGDLIGKSTISVRKYEANDITPSLQVLGDISVAFNITISDLTNNEPVINSDLYKDRAINNDIDIEKNTPYYELTIKKERIYQKEFNILCDKIEELESTIKHLEEINNLKEKRIKELTDLNDKLFSLLGGGTDGK